MTNHSDRLSGFADALDATEDLIRSLIHIASARTKPGLETALCVVREVRSNVRAAAVSAGQRW